MRNGRFLFQAEPELGAIEFIDVLRRSTLAERRPVDELDRIEGMLQNADVIVTARDSAGTLVGVSRALTDYKFCTYLSDLAVDAAVQGQGIGKQLIDETHRLSGLETTLILLAVPAARTYYPHVGLEPHDSCWTVRPTS
jgi:predicted N-acetyltransferase YhbS